MNNLLSCILLAQQISWCPSLTKVTTKVYLILQRTLNRTLVRSLYIKHKFYTLSTSLVTTAVKLKLVTVSLSLVLVLT